MISWKKFQYRKRYDSARNAEYTYYMLENGLGFNTVNGMTVHVIDNGKAVAFLIALRFNTVNGMTVHVI